MRHLRPIVLSFLVVLALASPALAGGLCSAYTNYSDGQTVNASSLNSSFTVAAVTNSTLACVSGQSANLTEMQGTRDPYPGASASLGTSAADEIKNLRHVIGSLTGWSYWYAHTEDINRAVTWNTAGTNFCLYCGSVTDTTSHVSSRLLDLKVNTVSKFAVDKGGDITSYGGAFPTNGQVFIGNATTGKWGAATLTAGSGTTITNSPGGITITAGSSASGFYSQVAGTTITGTNFADVTSHTITITTTGGKVLLNFSAGLDQATTTQTRTFTFAVDAVDQDATVLRSTQQETGNAATSLSIQQVVSGLAAGSHTFKVRAKVSAGTLNINNSEFSAVEIL